ncbi:MULTISPECIES: hypothetical protein [Chryseobacterium]|jgi:hypothetical protein|uniref:Uncharacterized protein n=2 Tax=Chryseobacterium aquaticum TaxID=452084 RepID=A0A0Q3HSA1_9FLAO|nr:MULTISPECIES: hypothetical protein [Chryseobacterium]KQK25551.1 hypothetical protein AR438_08055 [Chryseobacterium aquaticum]KUJ55947.1 hypothetical protein AR686_10065 [Chryseobacterium aquaticum subsp. greenlandense]NMR32614.1 hypothetical protein [Chryseobacterium aquaticum]NRQ45456.1 hypothetical protein [Chryseobacterium sp. C-204]
MERIKFFLDNAPIQNVTKADENVSINFSEIKSFLCEADNYSFDQIKLKLKPNRNKIVIDIATGIQYPAYDDFMTIIKQSKYAGYFDLQ